MKQRGRPSPSLAGPRLVEVYPRLPVPPELRGDEVDVYLDIINTSEGGWFTQANLPLLVQYCRHVIAARRIAELIEAAGTGPEWRQLLAAQRGESAVLAALALKMRIAQQSARNRTEGRQPRIGAAPWDVAKAGD